jgi:hypothetical protein
MMPSSVPSSPSARSVPALLRSEIGLLRSLRERCGRWVVPELLGRIDRALQVADCPSCAEAQADGVPCASPSRECEQCCHSLDWVRSLRQELEAAVERGSTSRADDGEI